LYKDIYINLLKRYNINLKSILNRFSLVSEDFLYIKLFEAEIVPKLFHMHIKGNYKSCVFCRHLYSPGCHNCCFACKKNTYSKCSCLLPGVFSSNDSYFSVMENNITPWIFRTPCPEFERLDAGSYFKNFTAPKHFITAENYEVLEGLFFGLTHNKRPCHICASTNIKIYNICTLDDACSSTEPCHKILKVLSYEYGAEPYWAVHMDENKAPVASC
jgi:hypothetical protein